MKEVKYFLEWQIFDKEKENSSFTSDICFRFLKQLGTIKDKKKYLQVKFENRLDKDDLLEGSTSNWFTFLSLLGIRDRYFSVKIEKNYYYVTLDIENLSYESALFLLTLARYPGEYYNVCYNFWNLYKKYPGIHLWKTFYLAHQGSFETEYKRVFDSSFYFNSGHTIFINGDIAVLKSATENLQLFDKEPSLYGGKSQFKRIQDFWPIREYRSCINFDEVDPLPLL